MKKVSIALILAISVAMSGFGQSSPRDLILVLDTSASMSASYQEVKNYMSGAMLKEHLRIGDTFHLIPFSGSARLDISRRIEGRGDLETVIGRMFLQFPLDAWSDIPGALSFAENYAATLPARAKKIILISDGVISLPPGSSSRAMDASGFDRFIADTKTRLNRGNISLEYINVTKPLPRTAPAQTPPPSPARPAAPAQTPAQTPGNPATPAQPPAQTPGSPAAPAQPPAQTPGSPATPAQPPAQTPGSPTAPAQPPVQTSGSPTDPAQPPAQSPTQGARQDDAPPTDDTQSAQNQDSTQPSDETAIDGEGATDSDGQPADTGTEAANTEDKTDDTETGTEITAENPPLPAQPAQTSQTSKPKKTWKGPSVGLLILLALIGLVVLLLIIFFVIRELHRSPNRAMSRAASPRGGDTGGDAPFTDHSKELASYAAAQSRQRTTPYADRRPSAAQPARPADPSAPMMLNLFVEDQNTSIGKRNIHSIKSGVSFSVGGGNSDFLIFLVPIPPSIGIIRRDGSSYTFIPKKPNYFPELGSQQVSDCIGKTIKIISDKKYEVRFRFEWYEDPLAALNKLLNSVNLPG